MRSNRLQIRHRVLCAGAIDAAVAVDRLLPACTRLWRQLEPWQDAWMGRPADRIEQQAATVRWMPAPRGGWCLRCGRVGEPDGDADARASSSPCGPACRSIGDGVIVLGRDAPPLDDWIRRVKRAGGDHAAGWWLGRHLGRQLQASGLVRGAGRPLITPVPAVAARRAGRGIDHTAVLAGAVADVCGGRLVRRVLRHGGGGRQAGRSRQQRLAAAPRAIRRGRGRLPLGATVILVDDIRTTGATLRAGVRSLREAGAGTVLVAVVAARDRRPE